MDLQQPTEQNQPARSQVWRFADCQFDEARHELRVHGVPVELEAKPLEVLHQLLLHAGEVVTKEELLDSVWPGLVVVDGSLATAISKLRRALGTDDGIVVTLPRVGYRLGVPVHRKSIAPPPWEGLNLEAGGHVPGREQWRLVRRLALSPFGEVWLAEHPKTGEARVFKFARSAGQLEGLKREVTVARLLRESLGKPRTDFVRVLEWQFDSKPYFVESEYAGPNLAEWAEAQGSLGTVAIDVRLKLLADVAKAVAAAHSVDVLHRDLKPGNILVTPGSGGNWQIRVADFGSASLAEPSRLAALGITNLGFPEDGTADGHALAGTLMYLAPEIVAGQSPSASADVYALGVLLYQTVVGDFRKPLSPGWEADVADPLVRDDIAEAACGDPTRRLASASALADRLLSLDRRRIERAHLEEARQRANSSGTGLTGSRIRRSWMAVAAGLLIAALVVTTSLYRRRGSPVRAGSTASAQVRSLAVLPLVNMSGDPSQDYLADGMTEALITDLSKIRALKVISRTSVMQYKGARKPLPQIASELNVDGIVEGSVAKSPDRVRVTAQLIHASTDTHLWAESYERDLQDILILQSELARQISREIKITVQPSEDRQLASSVRVNAEAHDLYLRGRFFWNRRTRDDLYKAVDYFRQATVIDSKYVLGYAGLADAYAELVGFGNIQPEEGVQKAKAAASKAIELNESLAEPHAALAYVLAANWEWAEAEKEFERALDLNPGYVTALYQYGFIISMLGRQDEAIKSIQRALELDPLSPIVMYRAGRVYYQARQYERARELFSRILELNANDPLGIYGLGLVFEAEGQLDRAVSYLQRENLQQGFDVAAAYALEGRTKEARRKLTDEIQRQRKQKIYIRSGWVAEVYVALGEEDEAFRWLERAYREHDAWLALLRVWPPFDPLRSDPRFQDLLRRLNFPS